MNKIVRALLISAAATGAFAFVLASLRERPAGEAAAAPGDPLLVDADRMPEAQQKALLDELASHL